MLPAKDHGGKVPYIEGGDYPEPYPGVLGSKQERGQGVAVAAFKPKNPKTLSP